MILTGNEDLRVIKTIEAIKSSFETLICEKDYEKITVKELCDRARINKKTFYNYYQTLDDLLSEMQMELSQGYIDRVKDYVLPDDLEKVNREFFLFSEQQGTAYEKITTSGNYEYVRERMISKVMNETWKKSERFNRLSSLEQKIILSYINTTTVEIYRLWTENGKKPPLEEIIALCNRLVCGGTKAFFERKTDL
jgi:AcrR family transcriptional regulator